MIRPTFLAFETAKSALTVSQLGLDTVGHNISNVSTPGYTRQRVDQVSLSSSVSTKYQVFGAKGQNSGMGAMFNGISQIRDPYLDIRYRNEAATYGELASKLNGLTDLQDILDEVSKDGLGVEFEKFLEQLTLYAASADSEEYASAVRNAAQSFCLMLNSTSNKLQSALTAQKEDLGVTITQDINASLEKIAYLNEAIRMENIYSNPANELMDERNLLLDSLAECLPIKVVNTPETLANGSTISRMSIVMVDNTTAPATEITLVDNKEFNGLSMSENADGTVNINLIEGSTGSVIQENITGSIIGGIVKGSLDIINGMGDFAGSGENTYRGVPYYIKALDAFANSFAQLMNTLNSVDSTEANDYVAAGVRNLFQARTGDTITAANIAISDQWAAEETWLLTTKQEPVVVHENEDDGLLYDQNGNVVNKNQLNNDNINKMIEQLKGSNVFSAYNNEGKRVTLFRGGYSEFLSNNAQVLGQDKDIATTMLTASAAVITGYADQRDAVSAVSIDEEAINMMTYQNYYNAAARYMTTIDEALGTIIQSMGVVGR